MIARVGLSISSAQANLETKTCATDLIICALLSPFAWDEKTVAA